MRRLTLALAVSLLLLLALGPAQALASHLSGAATACAAGTPITITQDEMLDQNITCTSHGIVIGAARITLDLNGYTITGAGDDFGIYNDGFAAVNILGNGSGAGNGGAEGTVQTFGQGVRLDNARRNRVTNLSSLGNSLYGIRITGGAGNRVEALDGNNQAKNNVNAGINVVNSNRNVITMRVDSNSGIGIHVAGTSSGNTIFGNLVTNNGTDGIFVAADTARTRLDTNTAGDGVGSGNGSDGIQVDSASATLTDNGASYNTGYGINAVPGVRDGGGNYASGNGSTDSSDGDQCLNIMCTDPTVTSLIESLGTLETESSTLSSQADVTDPPAAGDSSGCDGPWASTETEPGTNGDENLNGVVCTKEGPKGTMYTDDA